MKGLSYFARCIGVACLSLLSASLNAAESCDPNDDCAEGELSHENIFSLAETSKNQADFFKRAGISCERSTSAMGGYDGYREVMQYVEASSNTFDQKSSMQRTLRRLLRKYPAHPVLNWQAGWLSYLDNDFEDTITSFTIAANQGEPNAAYLLAFIGLGLLDGDDSLKPDDSIKLTPTDLPLSTKCLKVAVNADVNLEFDGGYYTPWFREAAMAKLAAVYIHDVESLYSFRSPWPNVDWQPIPYNLDAAQSLVSSLPYKDDYSTLRVKVESAVSANQAEERRIKEAEQKQKELESEEADRRYTASLQLTASQLAVLELKCAAYSTIKGVCWALDYHEMRSVLTSRGYVSKSSDRNSFRVDSRFGAIYIKNGLVTFNCRVFNACGLSMRELANRLQQSGIVTGDMAWSSEYSAGYIENTSSTTNSFCGRGLQGEKICVAQTASVLGPYSGTDDIKVILSKGLVGKEISFD
jgi:hypothetical protein